MCSENLVTADEDSEYIEAAVRGSVLRPDRMDVTQFLSLVGEGDVIQDVGEDGMVTDIVASLSDTEPIISIHEGQVEFILPAFTKQLEIIASAKLTLRSTCRKETGAVRALGRFQSTLKKKKRSEQSQSGISSFFS